MGKVGGKHTSQHVMQCSHAANHTVLQQPHWQSPSPAFTLPPPLSNAHRTTSPPAPGPTRPPPLPPDPKGMAKRLAKTSEVSAAGEQLVDNSSTFLMMGANAVAFSAAALPPPSASNGSPLSVCMRARKGRGGRKGGGTCNTGQPDMFAGCAATTGSA